MPIIDYEPLFQQLEDSDLSPWLDVLPNATKDALFNANNGHLPSWQSALEQLPDIAPTNYDLRGDAVSIGTSEEIAGDQAQSLETALRSFHPWRKGPFDFFGTYIDTEWHSDWKWNRLEPHIASLKGRTVLDIGSGNGYFCWRMAGSGAKLALGTDPFLLFVMQFFAARKYLPQSIPAHVIPFGIEELPPSLPVFDTVFSMGVLYHRRSPIDHLVELRDMLRPGGELVLETLVVNGSEGESLLPRSRYAKMRNVWFIPSNLTLESWMRRCGFKDIRIVDTTPTSIEEQRSTDWMHFDSLPTYLDPNDPTKTIEGYPAPLRSIVLATT